MAKDDEDDEKEPDMDTLDGLDSGDVPKRPTERTARLRVSPYLQQPLRSLEQAIKEIGRFKGSKDSEE